MKPRVGNICGENNLAVTLADQVTRGLERPVVIIEAYMVVLLLFAHPNDIVTEGHEGHVDGFDPPEQIRINRPRENESVNQAMLLKNRRQVDTIGRRSWRIMQRGKQHVLFAALHYSPRTPPDSIDLPPVLQEHGLIDGLILAGTIYPNLLRRIESIHMPFVAFSNNVVGMGEEQQYDHVGFDDYNGTLQATRYLISKGHRQIVFAADISYPWLHRRFEGYRQGMRENKLKPVLIMARNPQSFVDFGQKSAGRILSRQPRPTAAVAGNDEIAYGLWRSLQRHGMKVPDDISLVGFDDREEAVLMDPQLSTVRVHKEEIGETCMKMLLERLHHPHMAFSQRILPTEFVIRGTVCHL